jgi:hypothetical protein
MKNNLEKNRIQELDEMIAGSMKQIQCGQKILGNESYKKSKRK